MIVLLGIACSYINIYIQRPCISIYDMHYSPKTALGCRCSGGFGGRPMALAGHTAICDETINFRGLRKKKKKKKWNQLSNTIKSILILDLAEYGSHEHTCRWRPGPAAGHALGILPRGPRPAWKNSAVACYT